MGVPLVYRKSNENVIGSYNSQDLTSGVGYKDYYATIEEIYTGVASYALVDQSFDVSNRYFEGTTIQANYTKVGDYDFDIGFNKNLIVQGHCNIGYTIEPYGGAGGSISQYCVINIFHVDKNRVETLLGTKQGEVYSSSVRMSRRIMNEIIISTKNFRSGEIFRVNIEAWAKTTGGAANTWRLYVDPANNITPANDASGTAPDTTLKISVPFKIDL